MIYGIGKMFLILQLAEKNDRLEVGLEIECKHGNTKRERLEEVKQELQKALLDCSAVCTLLPYRTLSK